MKKTGIVLMITGALIVSFAVFCPWVIADIHDLAWRIAIGALGCFAVVTGVYKAVCRN